MIWHVVNSLKKSEKLKNIIVATSNNKSDNSLVDYLKKNNIVYFRGDLKNVAKRLYNCSQKYKKKYFIRVSGDSPLIDYKIVDKSIDIFKKKKYFDIITNTFPKTFPQGQSVEIIKASILKKNIKNMSNFDKEHVTTYFYKNFNKFKIKNFSTRKKFRIKNSVDTEDDLKRIRKILQ